MNYNIAVLSGDGIGPEVMTEAIKVLDKVGQKFGHQFAWHYRDMGGIAIDRHGTPLPNDTLKTCKKSDAVLLGAVGGPKWDDPKAKTRPEDGLLGLRKGLGLFANLRPVKVLPMLVDSTNFKPGIVTGVDLVVVRELTGGLYFGKPKRQWRTTRGRRAVDTLAYSEQEIERILQVGFELARSRRKKLTSVDKANVLESSRLWRQVAIEMAPRYPDVELEHMLVDSCAMRLIQRPADLDVVVTENTFGDILTDEASMLAGSMGMLPSASLSGGLSSGASFGLYEPIHGSAPRRAGQNLANPIATILSGAMMLRYSLGLEAEARAVEKAVLGVLEAGHRTYDIVEPGKTSVGTREMGDLVAGRI
ncbi:MAG: 3-isopropylmalate dehydrogenase [Chloroflexi bacterium]|nr:3-isopropylmalate dehydrogenase [Chloroflexota bacterium]